MKKNLHSIISIIAVLMLIVTPPASADSPNATATVTEFQDALIELMKKAKTLSIKQRYTFLEPSVSKAFHLRLMSKIATEQYWSEATHSERQELTMAFRRMSVSTLATLFSGYSGEQFRFIAEKDGPQKTRLVITEIVKSDKSTVNISYITRNFKQGWKIVDVIVDAGISELKVRRSEYRQILKSSGIPGLINILNNKADQLISG